MFEGGAIYSYVVERPERRRSFAVRREAMSALPDQGWRPVSNETTTVSSSCIEGTVQNIEFEHGDGTSETAVYSSKAYRVVFVSPEIWDYYSKLGAEKSWLGFPARSEEFPNIAGGQVFTGGVIWLRPGADPIAVSVAVMNLLIKGDSRGRIGSPVTEEQPVGTNGSDRIQFFQEGVVTLRDGKYEAWLRPEPISYGDAEPNPESLVEPPTTATSENSLMLPVANYDEMTAASLRARLRNLSLDELNQLLNYEKSHAARDDVITMFERRIAHVVREAYRPR
jgi:hypothetical protein